MPKELVVKLNCSFCDKNQREVKKLIAGPGVYICDECIGLCDQIIGEEVSPEDRREFAARSAQGIVGATIDQAIGSVLEVRGLLVSLAAKLPWTLILDRDGSHARSIDPGGVSRYLPAPT